MNKLLDFVERHKFGILATLMLHVAIFLYFQIATYKEAILYEPWDFITRDSEAPDDIEINLDQIQTAEEFFLFEQQEISSNVKDENDTREEGTEKNAYYSSYSGKGNPERLEDEYEQRVRDEIDKRNEERRMAEGEDGTQLETDNQLKEPIDSGREATEKSASGTTMVSYSLNNRSPLNNNDWYIRNPGYTCGNVNGVVKVEIVVDEGGRVVQANVIESQSQNVNSCMRDKAREYALMSRFNYDANAPKKQQGTITYKFVYK